MLAVKRILLTVYGMIYLDVIIPGPWWNTLTYILKESVVPPSGSRVRVPLSNTSRVGFVSGITDDSECEKNDVEYKEVTEVLDNSSVFGENLWDLALWVGHYFMCGAGEVLKVISPPQLLNGDSITQGKVFGEKELDVNRKFYESEC